MRFQDARKVCDEADEAFYEVARGKSRWSGDQTSAVRKVKVIGTSGRPYGTVGQVGWPPRIALRFIRGLFSFSPSGRTTRASSISFSGIGREKATADPSNAMLAMNLHEALFGRTTGLMEVCSFPPLAQCAKDGAPRRRIKIPGPQMRGTGATLGVVWDDYRDRGHLPKNKDAPRMGHPSVVPKSPVPKCEGPGAPSAWFGMIIETGATRQKTKTRQGWGTPASYRNPRSPKARDRGHPRRGLG